MPRWKPPAPLLPHVPVSVQPLPRARRRMAAQVRKLLHRPLQPHRWPPDLHQLLPH